LQQRQRTGGQIVQPWVAQVEGRLCLSRRLLLAKNVGNVIGAKRTGRGSFLESIGYRFGSILADQFQQLGELPREAAIGIRHVAQIGFQQGLGTKAFENREEALLSARASGGGAQLGKIGFEAIGAESLATAPAPRVGDDFVDAIVDSDGTGIGLEREAAAYKTWGRTVTVSIEVQAEIFVDESFHGIAIVVRNDRQRTQGIGLESIDGALTGFAVQSLVGDFRQPVPRLAIHIMQIGELPQWPETLARMADDALHFSFFPTCRNVAGFRIKAVFAGEGEKARKETDQTAVVLGDSGRQIVVGDLARDDRVGDIERCGEQ
jgi:hypothetical protein